MVRPKKRPGELGSVSFERRGPAVLARARIRLSNGETRSISAVGVTADIARAELGRRANQAWGFVPVRPDTTVADLARSWIEDLWARILADPTNPPLRPQTIEGYESTVRSVIGPGLSAVHVDQVTVAFANSFLRRVAVEKSPASANRARNALTQMFDLAIRHGAIEQQLNPIRGTERFRKNRTLYVEYDPGQIVRILNLLSHWNGGGHSSKPSPNVRVLIDLVLVILGTSVRIGEPLALRRGDVRFELSNDEEGRERVSTFVYVGGTMIRTKRHGMQRQDTPKNERQKRWIELPGYAARVVRRRMADYVEDRELNPDGLLFVNGSGRPFERQNLMRLLRSFRRSFQGDLEEVGVDPQTLTFKAFRKTVATALADEVGIERAAGLLGHSDPRVTEAHYSKPRVPIVNESEVLERLFAQLEDDEGPGST